MTFHKMRTTPRDLTDLPNISIALAEELRRTGISNPGELMTLGAETAWTRLRQRGQRDCIHTLLALGGAVLGIAWQSLPAERRFELMRFATRTMSDPVADALEPDRHESAA